MCSFLQLLAISVLALIFLSNTYISWQPCQTLRKKLLEVKMDVSFVQNLFDLQHNYQVGTWFQNSLFTYKLFLQIIASLCSYHF